MPILVAVLVALFAGSSYGGGVQPVAYRFDSAPTPAALGGRAGPRPEPDPVSGVHSSVLPDCRDVVDSLLSSSGTSSEADLVRGLYAALTDGLGASLTAAIPLDTLLQELHEACSTGDPSPDRAASWYDGARAADTVYGKIWAGFELGCIRWRMRLRSAVTEVVLGAASGSWPSSFSCQSSLDLIERILTEADLLIDAKRSHFRSAAEALTRDNLQSILEQRWQEADIESKPSPIAESARSPDPSPAYPPDYISIRQALIDKFTSLSSTISHSGRLQWIFDSFGIPSSRVSDLDPALVADLQPHNDAFVASTIDDSTAPLRQHVQQASKLFSRFLSNTDFLSPAAGTVQSLNALYPCREFIRSCYLIQLAVLVHFNFIRRLEMLASRTYVQLVADAFPDASEAQRQELVRLGLPLVLDRLHAETDPMREAVFREFVDQLPTTSLATILAVIDPPLEQISRDDFVGVYQSLLQVDAADTERQSLELQAEALTAQPMLLSSTMRLSASDIDFVRRFYAHFPVYRSFNQKSLSFETFDRFRKPFQDCVRLRPEELPSMVDAYLSRLHGAYRTALNAELGALGKQVADMLCDYLTKRATTYDSLTRTAGQILAVADLIMAHYVMTAMRLVEHHADLVLDDVQHLSKRIGRAVLSRSSWTPKLSAVVTAAAKAVTKDSARAYFNDDQFPFAVRLISALVMGCNPMVSVVLSTQFADLVEYQLPVPFE